MTDHAPRYDRLAADYDRAMRPLERLIFAPLRALALAEIAEGAHLIEVGAGTGANFPLYTRNARVAACEPSLEMLKVARGKPRPEGVRLVQARAEQLPFADQTFDAALATLVFCSVASPSAAFAELRRIVRAGGRVVLVEHVRPQGALGVLFDLFNPLTTWLLEDHINRRTAEEARRAGLRVLRTDRRAFGIVQLIVCEV
jgi:phosphatidylethanolamine/phosphatidyl-N-methylethanolamine N-methyltransferase